MMAGWSQATPMLQPLVLDHSEAAWRTGRVAGAWTTQGQTPHLGSFRLGP